MDKLVTFKQAGLWSAILFGLFILFHLSVILGIVLFDYAPIEYLWGGRMKTKEELLNFEWLSLAIMMMCLIIVSIRVRKIGLPILLSLSRLVLWLLFILFLLNTVGNLMAQSIFEKFFALITAALAVFCLRLAMEPLYNK